MWSQPRKSNILHKAFIKYWQKNISFCKHYQTIFIDWVHPVFLAQELLSVWNTYCNDKMFEATPICISYIFPQSRMFLLWHTPEELSRHVVLFKIIEKLPQFHEYMSLMFRQKLQCTERTLFLQILNTGYYFCNFITRLKRPIHKISPFALG